MFCHRANAYTAYMRCSCREMGFRLNFSEHPRTLKQSNDTHTAVVAVVSSNLIPDPVRLAKNVSLIVDRNSFAFADPLAQLITTFGTCGSLQTDTSAYE